MPKMTFNQLFQRSQLSQTELFLACEGKVSYPTIQRAIRGKALQVQKARELLKALNHVLGTTYVVADIQYGEEQADESDQIHFVA